MNAKQRLKSLPSRFRRVTTNKHVLYGVAGFIAAFLLLNLGVFLAYRQRTYPGTELQARPFGSTQYSTLDQRLTDEALLPQKLELQINGKKVAIAPAELGLRVDTVQTATAIKSAHAWLPIWNFIQKPQAPLFLTAEVNTFSKKMNALNTTYATQPTNARINQVKRTFEIQPESNGKSIDVAAAQTLMLRPDNLYGVIEVPLQVTPASISAKSLEPKLATLRTQASSKLIIQYGDKQKQLDTATVFVRSKEIYVPSSSAISEQIAAIGNSFGISVGNLTAATNAAVAAVSAGKSVSITLEKQTAKRAFTYCVSNRGVASSYLGGLRTKLRSVFADRRGWSLDGAVALTEVSTGCDFTVWLSQASQMPSFGAICDSMWSCRVGANVVINFDRWQNASPAWNAAGGSLDEYRAMVINHETGHWFGFYHRFCGGAGQPAPVMQQQSINLQGCTFNAWPTAAERADLKAQLGV